MSIHAISTRVDNNRLEKLLILLEMHRDIGTVNVSKGATWHGYPVGVWVAGLRKSIRESIHLDMQLSEFIDETGLFVLYDKDLSPLEVQKRGSLVSSKTAKKSLDTYIDENGKAKTITKAEQDSARDRAWFAELILRLATLKGQRGNIHTPKSYLMGSWDVTAILDDLRSKYSNGTLEPWKISALNALGMVWERSYPLR